MNNFIKGKISFPDFFTGIQFALFNKELDFYWQNRLSNVHSRNKMRRLSPKESFLSGGLQCLGF